MNFHIFISQAISSHDLTSVCFSTGTSSTYSNAFAFEVIDGIDAGFFQGYDLYGFRIQSCQALETSYLFAFEHFLTVSSIESDIVLDESDVNFALVQQVYVSNGSTSGLCRCVATGDVFVEDVSQCATQREVSTSSTASSNVNEFLCSRFFSVFFVTATTSNHSCHYHNTQKEY